MPAAHNPSYLSDGDAPAKRTILVAALDLFVNKGLCETTVRDIAKASGYTNPALFKHFATKDALALFLFESCYLDMHRLTIDAIASGTTFAARQRALLTGYMAALERDQNAFLFAQDNLRHFWPRASAAVKKHSVLGAIKKMLEDGRRAGDVTSTIDLMLLTTAWAGTIQQFTRARHFGQLKMTNKAAVAALDALLSRLVRE
ncbi:MAG TPA: TetR/AcrR family transcriptional regulator [Gemmatimonadaceae bacterium]|jgi:AcrR family transcriptional regulator|nr:TetR/AcrR family transcriptional regulator [Gemmatimonadaceae bacterium]